MEIIKRERAFKDKYSEHTAFIGSLSVGKLIKKAAIPDEFNKKSLKKLNDIAISDNKISKNGEESTSKKST